jgi:hypothetical protein
VQNWIPINFFFFCIHKRRRQALCVPPTNELSKDIANKNNFYSHTKCAVLIPRWNFINGSVSNRILWEPVMGRHHLKCDGTRWRSGGEVKGKLANGVGSQYPSHYLRNKVYPALLPLMRTPPLPLVDWTDAPANLNGLVRFAERRNLVSARVPSHFNWPVLCLCHSIVAICKDQ